MAGVAFKTSSDDSRFLFFSKTKQNKNSAKSGDDGGAASTIAVVFCTPKRKAALGFLIIRPLDSEDIESFFFFNRRVCAVFCSGSPRPIISLVSNDQSHREWQRFCCTGNRVKPAWPTCLFFSATDAWPAVVKLIRGHSQSSVTDKQSLVSLS